ncbi:hypothetical protein Acy02nite_37850 [Actinoplanes cyaneus]|uniref:Uncharacterized protein n=1 Tax=Actinoplanes cyaneus TaxID=52696 RepID=A0A919IHG4_9ACTN|nr:hypothetical protein Acy02nite_37850 [Actinoplanes cyaneus]
MVPSVTVPARGIVPVAASSASTSVVFPAPEWPTSTTLRTLPGSVTTGAVAPASPFSEVFCAMPSAPVVSGSLRVHKSHTRGCPGRKDRKPPEDAGW